MKDEEMQRKAIKVIDLLQLSAELGNTEALFTLAYVSLVRMIISTAVMALLTRSSVPSQYLFSLGP